MSSQNEVAFVEMFCGIGGFRFGIEKANQNLSRASEGQIPSGNREYSSNRGGKNGARRKQYSVYRCVWANDIDKYACQIYRKHYGDKELIEGDIRTIDPNTIPNHDLLTAGFPCQSFSLAGKRKGFEDTRGTLFYEVARIAKAKRPRLLLLENVKGLPSNDEGRTFAKILQTLDGLGYDVEWEVLNSKYFGVPQNRERVFIVGHLRGTGSRQIFPIGKVSERIAKSCKKAQGKRSRVRVANSLGVGGNFKERNLIASALIQSQGREAHIETRKDGVSHALKGKGGWEGNYVQIANTLSHRYGKDGSENLILSHSPRTNDPKLGGSGLLLSDEHCFTVDSRPHLLLNQRIRRLTPIECERLQGFPDGWTEDLSDTQRYKLLGNAVTTTVIEFLDTKLREAEA